MSGIPSWLGDRFPVTQGDLRELTNEPVPYHMKRWWFALGGTPAYLFIVQIVTGIMLAFYYEASAVRAYESVRFITEDVAFGWFIRSVHKWAATLMIAAVVLHQMRVYFTSAYRKPRELNWIVGMSLLMCTLLTGFTGYSLAFEQLSFWGVTVGANIADTMPLVGGMFKNLLLAGSTYNESTLPRFYVLHAAILPATIVLLVIAHIAMVRMQGVTTLRFKDETEEGRTFSFFPDHMYTELMIGLVLMILLAALATVFPAIIGPRADPLTTPEVIKPEWFFYVAFRWLKLFSATTAVLTMGFTVFLMFAWPWVDRIVTRVTRSEDTSVWIGIVAALTIVALTVWEGIVAH